MILPLSAWGAELSPDYHERSRIAAYREGFLVLGTMLALGLPVAFGHVDADDAGEALTVIAVMIMVALPLAGDPAPDRDTGFTPARDAGRHRPDQGAAGALPQ